MYKSYSTLRCDSNMSFFMANGCGLREERPEQISGNREVGPPRPRTVVGIGIIHRYEISIFYFGG